MERWIGKVAVVTGASSGIGASIARELVRQGMKVVGLARRSDKIERLVDDAEDGNHPRGELFALECDVTKEESVASAFAWIKETFGCVDVLVNNAGTLVESSLTGGTLEEWRRVFDVNVLGVCCVTREAVRLMRQNESERDDALVVHIDSLAGERVPAVPGFAVYPASKRALSALARTLRHELLGTKIRVTSISPGLVARTEFMESFSTFSSEVMAAMPALEPEDVAAALVYVLSTPPRVLVQDVVLRPLGETW